MISGWATDDAAGGPLPPGWHADTDRASGKTYYYNATTRETSWKRPLAAAAADSRGAGPSGTAAKALGPREAQRAQATARRKEREAKQREEWKRNEEQLKRVHHRVGARVDDGDDEAAVGNTRPRGAARFALKSPRSQKKEAATVVQAQFRGRQARSLSPTPGAGLRREASDVFR